MNGKKSYKIWAAALAVIAVISAVLVSAVLAKYSSWATSGGKIATSQEFFFECSFEHDGSYLFPVGNDFEFTVRNHDAHGNCNQTDITYTVKLNDVQLDEVFTLTSGAERSQEHTISSDKFTVGHKYKVTIESSAPYKKTIEFTISAVEATAKTLYTVADKGNWVQLDLYVGSEPPELLTVNYGLLAPDNTNELMREWKTADGQQTLSGLDAYTHYTLIFFGDAEVTEVPERAEITDNTITIPTE